MLKESGSETRRYTDDNTAAVQSVRAVMQNLENSVSGLRIEMAQGLEELERNIREQANAAEERRQTQNALHQSRMSDVERNQWSSDGAMDRLRQKLAETEDRCEELVRQAIATQEHVSGLQAHGRRGKRKEC